MNHKSLAQAVKTITKKLEVGVQILIRTSAAK